MTVLALPGSAAPAAARVWLGRHAFAVRLGVVLTCIGGAYHYSLLTLVRALGLETPLAYLGLVPVLALGVGLARARPRPGEPAIHDRQVDVIVGVPLLLVALAMTWLLPGTLDAQYWVWRVDLLGLPLFAAGAIALVFGIRSLWRLRLALGLLLLAWPLPWTVLLSRWLESFTDLTVAGLTAALGVAPVGAPLAGSDGSLFSIVHEGVPFTVSVASACSGVNGMVGFLLVGTVCSLLVEGGRWRKVLWLASGAVLLWVLNLLRLLVIFWAGGQLGESFAIDGLHPVIGLVLFLVGMVAMALAMPLFGLRVDVAPRPEVELAPHQRSAVPRARLALAAVVVAALTTGVANAGMRDYQLFAGDLGAPRGAGFQAAGALPGYTGGNVASYGWATRFFGDDSTWLRYSYRSTTDLQAAALTVDVVSTASLGPLRDYGIEACYRFHGYAPTSPVDVDLGGGVRGQVLSYTDPRRGSRVDVLHWVWPVLGRDGEVRYERVAVLDTGAERARTEPDVSVVRASRGTSAPPSVRDAPAGDALLAFATAVVRGRSAADGSGGSVGSVPVQAPGTSVQVGVSRQRLR